MPSDAASCRAQAAECHAEAAKCRQRAENASDVSVTRDLLVMAKYWDDLGSYYDALEKQSN